MTEPNGRGMQDRSGATTTAGARPALAGELARYAKLGWTVRLVADPGSGTDRASIIALETGQDVDVLEAPYTAGILALDEWEESGRPGTCVDGRAQQGLVRGPGWPLAVARRRPHRRARGDPGSRPAGHPLVG
jgi:hypothetical protein